MEGIAKALATMLLGTTVQLDQSAYFDTSCYVIVHAPEPHVVLEGTFRAKASDSAWETADSFILPLGPKDCIPESDEGGFFSDSEMSAGKNVLVGSMERSST